MGSPELTASERNSRLAVRPRNGRRRCAPPRALPRSAPPRAMASDDRTDRFRPVFEPEEIFDRFVKNANASTEARLPRDDEPTGLVTTGAGEPRRGGPPSWDHAITVVAPPEPKADADPDRTRPDAPLRVEAPPTPPSAPDVDEEDTTAVKQSPLTDSGQRILLLTRVKRPGASEPPPPPQRESPSWESVVSPRGQHTQKLEALRVVPDVGAVAQQESPHVAEGVEDGQMPTRELDQILSDMAVLLRYGHGAQVRERLEHLRRTYPEDLLLLRAIAEFHVAHGDTEAALETLFALAGGLFERRNVEGMRQALEQVLVLDPDNARAYRLLGLLEQRPKGAAGD